MKAVQVSNKIAEKSRGDNVAEPPAFYSATFWRMGLFLARVLPWRCSLLISAAVVEVYRRLARKRYEAVLRNLLPVMNGDASAAEEKARRLFSNFSSKLVDLLRYEAGHPIEPVLGDAEGWDHFVDAQSRNRGVLVITPHLGNWEFGAQFLVRKGQDLLVATLREPGKHFTELRQAARALRNVKTFVVGEDPFAFIEVIKRLQAGATVALLVDRPPKPGSVPVKLFERSFPASIAAAELARASGCMVVPVIVPERGGKYHAKMLPAIEYDRALLRDRGSRIELTQKIIEVFEPFIRTYADQWYHFVDVWEREPGSDEPKKTTGADD